jgi:hypothetical protein
VLGGFDGVVTAVETAWLEAIRACELYVYRFDGATFVRTEASSRFVTSTESVVPLSVEPVGDQSRALAMIRMRNAGSGPAIWAEPPRADRA